MWLRGRHATPLVTTYFSPTLLPWELRIWESAFYSRMFFYLGLLSAFLRLPWDRQFDLKVSRASCWSSKHTTGPAICLNHSNPQKIHVWLWNVSFEISASYRVWTLFMISEHVKSLMFYPFGYRALQAVTK